MVLLHISHYTHMANNINKFSITKSRIDGVGLYVTKSYKKGDFIAHIKGDKVVIKDFTPALSKMGWNWIGSSRYTWINTDNSPFRYINHSCDPNVAIRGERTVYALKPIKVGNEITMDYSLTECQDDWLIPRCLCGAKSCRKTIRSIQYLDKKTFIEKRTAIPKRFQEIFINNSRKNT
jgi:uncharacterized protein